MTELRKMNAKERFDSANELVERISSEPEFDAFFMRFYNGKTLELDDDPMDEFENARHLIKTGIF
ncbi:MAG: hypothetical protein Q8M95_13930 [Candidatus Methanoperedens sp.]|nr:hypothetical protein [Candidatus Methanoperedens sp.]